jgi:hypothetical protein
VVLVVGVYDKAKPDIGNIIKYLNLAVGKLMMVQVTKAAIVA